VLCLKRSVCAGLGYAALGTGGAAHRLRDDSCDGLAQLRRIGRQRAELCDHCLRPLPHARSSELQPQIRSTQPVAIVETYCTTRGDSRVAAWRGVAPSCGRLQRRVRARRQSCQLRRAGPFRQAAHDIHAGAKISARAFLRVKPQSPSPEIVSHSVSWRSFSMIAAIAPACARRLLEAPTCSARARERVGACVRACVRACMHTCRERRWRRTGDRIASLLAQAVPRVRCAGFSHERVRQLDQCSGAPHDALCSDPSGRGRRREQRIPRRRVRLRRPCCD